MELVVASKHHLCETFLATDVSGREHLVVIIKGCWRFPAPNQRPRPIAPEPFVITDDFYGPPGESAMRYGADHVRFKPRCDVLFDACAHAPGNRPVSQLDVQVQVGGWSKTVRVVGGRAWQQKSSSFVPGSPAPFVEMPLHYGHAFGGSREYQQDQTTLCESLLSNPVGMGWGGGHTLQTLLHEPLPNLEYPRDSVRSPTGEHQPAALSAVARHWHPRTQYTGTYDDAWRREIAPFLPEDFDERFFQCAPQDQQIDYPQGGEDVSLTNLLAENSRFLFRLPTVSDMKVRILRKDYSQETLEAVVDTLYFETEAKRFSVVWRASTPIRRRIHEFDTVAVGAVSPHWWQARSEGCVGCSSPEEGK